MLINKVFEQMLILYNELNLLHKLKYKPHPQRPQRIEMTIKYLRQTKFSKFIIETVQLKEKLKISDEQINQKVQNQIITVHGKRYFDFIEGMWCEGMSKPQMFINLDTYYIKETYLSAFEAVKTTILAVEQIISEKNIKKDVICLVRPPGHHSGMKNQPHGFSFFNNIAIGANYFVEKQKKNVVIIDWDIHHGEGTQKIFYNRKDVLYISLHRFDNGAFFPHIKQSGCGYFGQKQGQGFNVNICWNFPKIQKDQIRKDNQTVRDEEYLYCFENIIIPILKQYQFQAIFVSCGFDCASGDQIGDSKITKKGFLNMSRALKKFNKQLFFVLEGGYNLQALQWGIQSVLQGVNNLQKNEDSFQPIKQTPINFQTLNQFAQKDINEAVEGLKRYWKL